MIDYRLKVYPENVLKFFFFSETPYQLNADIGVDFAPSADVGILFISLKYHNYRPKYVEDKIASIPRSKYRVLVLLLSGMKINILTTGVLWFSSKSCSPEVTKSCSENHGLLKTVKFRIRIFYPYKFLPRSYILLQFITVKSISVDSEGPDLASRYLSILCTKLDITFMVGFGQSECAQYITNFKRLEHKSVDWLRPKTDETNRLARVLGKKIENFLSHIFVLLIFLKLEKLKVLN